jgi:hypothetical protein
MCNLLSLRIGPNEHARAPRYSASVDARFHDDQLVAADCPSGCIWVDGNKSMVMALSVAVDRRSVRISQLYIHCHQYNKTCIIAGQPMTCMTLLWL